MSTKEFYITVKAMRQAQREYFSTRSKESLLKAKDLEKQVDEELLRIAIMMQ